LFCRYLFLYLARTCNAFKIKTIPMNKLELKKHFHQLIDKIDNGDLLIKFYDLMKRSSSSGEGQLWNRLTKEEQEELIRAVDESENSENLISNEQMKSKHKKWL